MMFLVVKFEMIVFVLVFVILFFIFLNCIQSSIINCTSKFYVSWALVVLSVILATQKREIKRIELQTLS
jgi:hypothetical protein